MARVAARIRDRRMLRLIRSYLTAGVLNNGLFEVSLEGTPQGGPLSPLLSNFVLDELDRELEHRGHRFVRYADDCNVYVRSEKGGRRVMENLTCFIEGHLKLQVNAQKSAVARPWQRSFLGFTVTDDPQPRRRIADKAVARFKDRARDLTRRHRGVSLDRMIADLNPLLRGGPDISASASCTSWHRWTADTETPALRRLGPVEDAGQSLSRTSSPEGHREGGQRGHLQPEGAVAAEFFSALHRAFPNKRFKGLGLFSMDTLAGAYPSNRRGTDPYARWCGRGGVARRPPIPIDGGEHSASLMSGGVRSDTRAQICLSRFDKSLDTPDSRSVLESFLADYPTARTAGRSPDCPDGRTPLGPGPTALRYASTQSIRRMQGAASRASTSADCARSQEAPCQTAAPIRGDELLDGYAGKSFNDWDEYEGHP